MDKRTIGYSHTMEYYLAMKKNELLMDSAKIWLYFKSIMLSKRKHAQETKYVMISFILEPRQGKLCRQEAEQWLGGAVTKDCRSAG